MLTAEQLGKVNTRLRVVQVVALGMIIGALVFSGIIMAIADWSLVGSPVKLFNLLGGGTAIMLYAIAFIAAPMLPRLPDNIKKQAGEVNEAQLLKVLQGIIAILSTEVVISYALFQGGMFLNIMVFMLEPRWITLIAAGIGFLLMLFCFPFKFRLVTKLEERFEEWKRG